MVAGPEVRNLAQLAAGDQVQMDYYSSTTLAMASPEDTGEPAGAIVTGRAPEGALPGVTRGAVLELAPQAGLATSEVALGLYDLYNAHECFLTGTGAEIVPVITIDGRQIGNGRPGPATLDLMQRFRELRVRDGHKVVYPEPAAREAAAT